MNHSALKKFAAKARQDLIEQVAARLKYVLHADSVELREKEDQIKQLREELKSQTEDQLVDRVAYIWFNRLAALRFMDAENRHPFACRVITATEGNTQPELIQQARNRVIPQEFNVDSNQINELLDGKIRSKNPQAEVYRMLVVAACNFYNQLMPFVFEKIADYTELLLPDDLLSEASLVEGFRSDISDEDCQEVEVIGWLYQYYIAEKKDAVMARKKAVPKEDIPAVTQLFTPHWIVKYMVENSLGRLWMNSSYSMRLRESMDYYIDAAVEDFSDTSKEAPIYQPYWNEMGVDHKEYDCDSFMWIRPNRDLIENPEDAFWYALVIDGYEYGRRKWRIETLDGSGRDKLDELKKIGLDKLSFEDLRYCLFVVQRAIKWCHGLERDELITEFTEIYKAVCDAWDREWKNNIDKQPDYRRIFKAYYEETKLKVRSPEEIKLIDPACGSGHILTYAFDLLYDIYEEEGYEPNSIPGHILSKNLHGVEIDERAAEMAYFALMMKAQQRYGRFLRRQLRTEEKERVVPNICCLQDIHFSEGEVEDVASHQWVVGHYLSKEDIRKRTINGRAPELDNDIHLRQQLKDDIWEDFLHDCNIYREAKNFGSLIQPKLTAEQCQEIRETVENCEQPPTIEKPVLQVLHQSEMLSQRYHCVVANPPYMNKFNGPLKTFMEKNFKDYKSDLFAAFMVRAKELTIESGLLGFMTPFVWMFISSYEKLRANILDQSTLTSLIQLEYSGFDGATVPICTFTVMNKHLPDYKGGFVRLTDFKGAKLQGPKALEIIQAANRVGK